MTMAHGAGMETPSDREAGEPLPLHPERRAPELPAPLPVPAGGAGSGGGDAAKIVDALKSSADQEFNIAERLAGKARQAFGLAAGVFVVAQTVAFGGFEASQLTPHERHWIIGLAITAVSFLALAVTSTIKTDATYQSGDLPLAALEDDLNDAYNGAPDVIPRLGTYYLTIVKTRRDANRRRRHWYQGTRLLVLASLAATTAELLYSLVGRTS